MRIMSVCLPVCQSVRQSVKRVDCDKTEERSVQIFIPYERSLGLVFKEEEWFLATTPFTWNIGLTYPDVAKSRILNPYSLVSPQP